MTKELLKNQEKALFYLNNTYSTLILGTEKWFGGFL